MYKKSLCITLKMQLKIYFFIIYNSNINLNKLLIMKIHKCVFKL